MRTKIVIAQIVVRTEVCTKVFIGSQKLQFGHLVTKTDGRVFYAKIHRMKNCIDIRNYTLSFLFH